MKKSMQQQLQSRISLRRNMIREIEADILQAKKVANYTMLIGINGSSEIKVEAAKMMYKAIRQGKDELNMIRVDQKLDKQLYALLVDVERSSRFYLMMGSVV